MGLVWKWKKLDIIFFSEMFIYIGVFVNVFIVEFVLVVEEIEVEFCVLGFYFKLGIIILDLE